MSDFALRAAIVDALDDITGGIYSVVPPKTPLPYTRAGEVTSVPWDTHDANGHESTITLHTFSDGNDYEEAESISEEIYTRLHHQELELNDGTLVMLRREFKEVLHEQLEVPGRQAVHVVSRFRALISA